MAIHLILHFKPSMARLLKAGVCVLLCFIKSHFPFQIAQMVATKVFNKTSSVYQTPVERQWLDTNLVTRKFKEHFRIIEAMGEFSSDSNSDIFSLTSVYMPELVSDVNAHYEAMRYCKKKVYKRPIQTTPKARVYICTKNTEAAWSSR